MLKKIISFIFIVFLAFFLIKPVNAQEEKVIIHFFWAKGCPHCAKEKVFLQNLKQKYPQITIQDYEVTSNPENAKLLQKVGKELDADVSGVPFTTIGEHYILGYYSDEITGKEIEEKLNCAIETKCQDVVKTVSQKDKLQIQKPASNSIPESIRVPIFGEIMTKDLSLPAFTFVIAALDGFNPCAMWVLLFLISLLLGMKNRLKMFILGSVFIIASGLVYFLFLSAWLNLFLFLGLVLWVRLVIGLVAATAGFYNLKEYFTKKDVVCKVTKNQNRKKVFDRLKKITLEKQFIVAFLGIIILAFAVNLVELVCSAGLPAVYTKVISLTDLPSWKYYLYLLFYILIFMLDDLIVFFAAMITFHAVGLDNKYSRISQLVGGLIMLLIGILMWIKPELLMFG